MISSEAILIRYLDHQAIFPTQHILKSASWRCLVPPFPPLAFTPSVNLVSIALISTVYIKWWFQAEGKLNRAMLKMLGSAEKMCHEQVCAIEFPVDLPIFISVIVHQWTITSMQLPKESKCDFLSFNCSSSKTLTERASKPM